MNPSREDYLLFAQYSDQIDRSVRSEVDAVAMTFPSAQPFHQPAVVLSDAEFKQRRAEAMQREAERALTITEAPQCWDEDEWRDQALSRHRRKYGRGIVLAVAIMAGCVLAIIGVLYAVKHGWLS